MNGKIKKETKETLAVIGLGRVGLPLALVFAEEGYRVIGVDSNPAVLDTLANKTMPFREEGGPVLLKRHLGKRLLLTGSLMEAAAKASALILTLGTPVDENLNPVFSQIERVLGQIVQCLRRGHIIILRSTVYPGTLEYIKRYLESKTSMKVGRDIHLAFCPERITEGKALEEIYEIPQLIGTLDEGSSRRAQKIFAKIPPKFLLSDARSVELAKLFCNVFRYITFAISNELMMIAQDHDRNIFDIHRLVNEGYKRGGLKLPGLSGGPCLYKDGFFLLRDVSYPELITSAWRINESVPAFMVSQIRRLAGSLIDREVLICGLSFKKDSDDNRRSLSYKLRRILHNEGAKVTLHDPFLAPGSLPKLLSKADIIFFATNHTQYEKFGWPRLSSNVRPNAWICDIWNLFGQDKLCYQSGKEE